MKVVAVLYPGGSAADDPEVLGCAENALGLRKSLEEEGHLGGYAGDVWYPEPAPPDHPWRQMPRHAMTPHVSGTTLEAQQRYAAGVRNSRETFLAGNPIGALQQRNFTVRGGNCNHRRYIPKLVGLVVTGALDPTEILTQMEPATGAIEAYETFDQRRPGWIKVELLPEAS
jgi:hypothetical protein